MHDTRGRDLPPAEAGSQTGRHREPPAEAGGYGSYTGFAGFGAETSNLQVALTRQSMAARLTPTFARNPGGETHAGPAGETPALR